MAIAITIIYSFILALKRFCCVLPTYRFGVDNTQGLRGLRCQTIINQNEILSQASETSRDQPIPGFSCIDS